MTNLIFSLKADDLKNFKKTVIDEEKTMTSVLEGLIREYIGNSD